MRKAFSKDRSKGFYIVLIAGALVAILTICGLVIDGSNLFLAQLRVQRVVDAAALSALKLRDSKPDQFVEEATMQLMRDSLTQMGYTFTLVPWADSSPLEVRVKAYVDVPLFIMNTLPGFNDVMVLDAEAIAGVPPTIIELALDTTDSMNRTISCTGSPTGTCVKGVKLKEAAKAFVDQLDESGRDYLGVVAFGSVVMTPDLAPAPITPALKASVKTAIDNIVFEQATCIACGLERARRHISSIPSNSFRIPPKTFVVLFTDGSPNAKNPGTGNYAASFNQCWNADNVWDKNPDNPEPVWGLYSSDFTTVALHNLPPTNLYTNHNDAGVIWETVNAGNRLALAGVTTYVIGLTQNSWIGGLATGCHDSSPGSPCPSYLLNIDTPYTMNSADATWIYNTQEGLVSKQLFDWGYVSHGQLLFNPVPNPNNYNQQSFPDSLHYDIHSAATNFRGSHPLYGLCPATEPPIPSDPFHLCQYDYNPTLLRRLANDPAMIPPVGPPDPIYPYRPDGPWSSTIPNAPNLPGGLTQAQLDALCAVTPTAWQCTYWDECMHRVGDTYPRGKAWITPDPGELPALFLTVLQEIRSKARLLPHEH